MAVSSSLSSEQERLSNHALVETLYLGHGHWLRSWLMSRLGCSEQAADIAQDTFVRMLRKQGELHIQEPRAYLKTIAQGMVANHFRRQDVERAYLNALATLPESVAPSEEARHEILETLLEVDRRLQTLDGPVRQAFLLFQLEGMRQTDIAARLNISLATVKRYITRALVLCSFDDD